MYTVEVSPFGFLPHLTVLASHSLRLHLRSAFAPSSILHCHQYRTHLKLMKLETIRKLRRCESGDGAKLETIRKRNFHSMCKCICMLIFQILFGFIIKVPELLLNIFLLKLFFTIIKFSFKIIIYIYLESRFIF